RTLAFTRGVILQIGVRYADRGIHPRRHSTDRCPLRGPGRHSRQKKEEWQAPERHSLSAQRAAEPPGRLHSESFHACYEELGIHTVSFYRQLFAARTVAFTSGVIGLVSCLVATMTSLNVYSAGSLLRSSLRRNRPDKVEGPDHDFQPAARH